MDIVTHSMHFLSVQVILSCLFPQIWEESAHLHIIAEFIVHLLRTLVFKEILADVLVSWTMRVCVQHPIVFRIDRIQLEYIIIYRDLKWTIVKSIEL